MAKRKRNVALVAAGITAAATLTAALVTGGFGLVKPNAGSSTTISGNTGCVMNGDNNSCNPFPEEPGPRSTRHPSGSGPWPFLTVDTWNSKGADSGVAVRKCTQSDCGCPEPGPGCRLGVVRGNETIYAACRQDGGWDPLPDDGKDPVWFKIKWPTEEFSQTNVHVSSRGDAHWGWIYSLFISPKDHNGAIPTC